MLSKQMFLECSYKCPAYIFPNIDFLTRGVLVSTSRSLRDLTGAASTWFKKYKTWKCRPPYKCDHNVSSGGDRMYCEDLDPYWLHWSALLIAFIYLLAQEKKSRRFSLYISMVCNFRLWITTLTFFWNGNRRVSPTYNFNWVGSPRLS